MTLSIFNDKSIVPFESSVIRELDNTYKLWEDIIKFVYERFPKAAEEWKYPGKNYGWSFRLKDKKRIIIYMTPQKGYFITALVFGDNAYREILKSEVSEDIKENLRKAKVYIEGRGIRIEVYDIKPVNDIKRLIEIKLRN